MFVLGLRLIRAAFGLHFHPSIHRRFPNLRNSLLQGTLHLRVTNCLIRRTGRSHFRIVLARQSGVLRFLRCLVISTRLPISCRALPIFKFQDSVTVRRFRRRELVRSVLPIFLLRLISRQGPRLLVRSPGKDPIRRVVDPVAFNPNALTLRSRIVGTFRSRLSRAVVRCLTLSLTIRRLTRRFLRLFADFQGHRFRNGRVGRVVLRQIFLRVPERNYTYQVEGLRLPQLTRIIRRLRMVLYFHRILIVLMFRLVQCFLPG